jgi:hypothetical protein
MIGYVLWLLAGVVVGVWLAPFLQTAKAAARRRLGESDSLRDQAPTFRDDDPNSH